eukprot:6186940-Pleurochrysis_carterae.AAC.1
MFGCDCACLAATAPATAGMHVGVRTFAHASAFLPNRAPLKVGKACGAGDYPTSVDVCEA